jgi:hypothetical protein
MPARAQQAPFRAGGSNHCKITQIDSMSRGRRSRRFITQELHKKDLAGAALLLDVGQANINAAALRVRAGADLLTISIRRSSQDWRMPR